MYGICPILVRNVARELDGAPERTTRLIEEPVVAGAPSLTNWSGDR